MYAYWVCAANETPIFSHEFPFRSISFLQISKKSVPEHHHLADFAVPETIIFKISLISTRSSPPTAAAQRVRQRRGLAAVPETRIFKRSAAPRVGGRSGAPHFYAQNGSSSFRSPHFQAQNGSSSFRRPPFSRSNGSSFRRPLPFFALCRGTYLPKFGVSTPPPPGTVVQWFVLSTRNQRVVGSNPTRCVCP